MSPPSGRALPLGSGAFVQFGRRRHIGAIPLVLVLANPVHQGVRHKPIPDKLATQAHSFNALRFAEDPPQRAYEGI
jgi:hypothetical protein